MTECSIRVICRFRPLNKREIEYGEHMQFLDFGVDKQSVVVSNGNKKEQFSKIFKTLSKTKNVGI